MSLSVEEIRTSQINTKTEFVDFMFDLISYTPNKFTNNLSLLDAGCGKGNFLVNAIDRFLTSLRFNNIDVNTLSFNISNLFTGYEFDSYLCSIAKNRIIELLSSKGNFPKTIAKSTANKIIRQGDFLKWKTDMKYDIIVENPPFIRYDNLSNEYIEWLKENYSCFRGRSDFCVPFIQRSLELLSDRGILALICTNRFTLCNYGYNLRNLIKNNFHISHIIDCTAIQPFDKPVSTYPWIFIIDKKDDIFFQFSRLNKSNNLSIYNLNWDKIEYDYLSNKPWRMLSKDDLDFWYNIKNHNDRVLGDLIYGIDVKVGIATGADKVFINPPKEAKIESELLISFILSKRLRNDVFHYKKDLLMNTWDPDNPKSLINLGDWPNAAKYLEKHEDKLKSRYVAKKDKNKWYRLIDAFNPNILKKEKLIFPSFRKTLDIYYDSGTAFPHHNCYYAIKKGKTGPSLKAVGALLSSNIGKRIADILFIRFNGNAGRLLKSNFLEFPIPNHNKLLSIERELEQAFMANNKEKINSLSYNLYYS